VYADEIITTVKNRLADNNFSLQDTVRHEVVLDMNASSVTTAVQTKVQDIVAMQYGVGVHKIQITEHESDSAVAKTTTLNIMVKTLREWGDVSDFSKYSIRQPTREMLTKVDAALVVATYKHIQKDKNNQNEQTNSAENTDNSSIGTVLLSLLVGLLLILLLVLVLSIVMGLGIFARQKPTNYADYNTIQTPNKQAPRDMHMLQGRAQPSWHHHPMRY